MPTHVDARFLERLADSFSDRFHDQLQEAPDVTKVALQIFPFVGMMFGLVLVFFGKRFVKPTLFAAAFWGAFSCLGLFLDVAIPEKTAVPSLTRVLIRLILALLLAALAIGAIPMLLFFVGGYIGLLFSGFLWQLCGAAVMGVVGNKAENIFKPGAAETAVRVLFFATVSLVCGWVVSSKSFFNWACTLVSTMLGGYVFCLSLDHVFLLHAPDYYTPLFEIEHLLNSSAKE